MISPFSKLCFAICVSAFAVGVSAQDSVVAAPSATVSAATDQNEAIISEKNSVKLVGDSSVGESISRRPDLSFANVTINGQGSGMSLGSIPADAVESVEVMKAVTPDVDADTRNGAISLKTKPTYEQKLRAKGTVELEYKATGGSLSNEEVFSWGGKLNEAGTWGGRINLRQENDKRLFETLSNDWNSENINGTEVFVLSESRIDSFDREDEEREIGGVLDYKASETLSFSGRANWLSVDRDIYLPRLKYQYGRGTFVSGDATGASVTGADVQRSTLGWSDDQTELEASFGSLFENEVLEAEFQYVYLEEDRYQPNFMQVDFSLEDVDLQYDLSSPGFPTTVATDGTDINDPTLFVFEDMNNQQGWRNETSDTAVVLDLKMKNLGAKDQGFLKGGFKTRTRDLFRVSGDNVYDSFEGGSYTLADVQHTGNIGLTIDGRYDLGVVPGIDESRAFLANNQGDFSLSELRTRERADSNSYTADETVDSAYAMFSWQLEKWRYVVGWRQEKTQVSFTANEVIIGADVDDKDGDGDVDESVYLATNPTSGDNSYTNDFPNFHLRYQWSEKLSVIGSFTNTIKRPEYGEVVPYRRVNRDDLKVREGNPNLKPTLYENLDLSLDFAFTTANKLSVELFKKSVEDIVFSSKSVVSSGVYSGYELSRNENGPTATIQGAKLTWQAPLEAEFLPKGLSFNANYTLNDSETEYPERLGEVLPVTTIPDSAFRFALNYQTDKIFAQLLYSRIDASLLRVGDVASEDRFVHTRNQINVDFSYKINSKLRFFVEGRDIRSEPNQSWYEGDESRLSRYRNFQWSVSSGLKFEL